MNTSAEDGIGHKRSAQEEIAEPADQISHQRPPPAKIPRATMSVEPYASNAIRLASSAASRFT